MMTRSAIDGGARLSSAGVQEAAANDRNTSAQNTIENIHVPAQQIQTKKSMPHPKQDDCRNHPRDKKNGKTTAMHEEVGPNQGKKVDSARFRTSS